MSSQFDEDTRKTISDTQLQSTKIKKRKGVDICNSLSGHQNCTWNSVIKFKTNLVPGFTTHESGISVSHESVHWTSNCSLLPRQRPTARVPFVSLLELLFSCCWLHTALFWVQKFYNELCYWECQIIILSVKPSAYFDCRWPMGIPTVVNPIEWLYFTVIMDFPHGLHRLLVINVNIPCSRANIWIVCAMNECIVGWLIKTLYNKACRISFSW